MDLIKITRILYFCTFFLLLTPSKGYAQQALSAIEKQIIGQVEPHREKALSAVEEQIIGHIERHTDEALSFLEQITNLNSGTMNHEGVRAVGRLFQAELAALGFETRWIPMPDSVNRAGHLFAYRKGSQGKRLLLLGHLDTVFERDSPFQRFERRDSVVAHEGHRDAGPVEAFDPGRRGAADISFVDDYVTGLDGLGVTGRGAHSPEEVMDLHTFPILMKRAALLMYRLTRGQ